MRECAPKARVERRVRRRQAPFAFFVFFVAKHEPGRSAALQAAKRRPRLAKPKVSGAAGLTGAVLSASARLMAEPSSNGVHVRPDFLPFPALLKLLAGLDRLSANWASSQALGLLGRGHTSQIRVTDIAVQSQLDEIGRALAPAALQWARRCGFWFSDAAPVQLFPVRMIGDAQTPAYQDPHVDSYAGQANPPICTNVFYARTQAIEGGGLAVARSELDLNNPIVIHPTANTMVTFAGDRVHWVQPLYAGERLSLVIDFY